jgi:hypothetical protein
MYSIDLTTYVDPSIRFEMLDPLYISRYSTVAAIDGVPLLRGLQIVNLFRNGVTPVWFCEYQQCAIVCKRRMNRYRICDFSTMGYVGIVPIRDLTSRRGVSGAECLL